MCQQMITDEIPQDIFEEVKSSPTFIQEKQEYFKPLPT